QASGGFPGPSGGRERLSGGVLLSGGRLMPRQSVIRYGKWPPLSPRRGTFGLAQVGGSPKWAIPGAQSLNPLTSLVSQPHPRVQGFAFLADLEIELRPGAAAAVTGLGDG